MARIIVFSFHTELFCKHGTDRYSKYEHKKFAFILKWIEGIEYQNDVDNLQMLTSDYRPILSKGIKAYSELDNAGKTALSRAFVDFIVGMMDDFAKGIGGVIHSYDMTAASVHDLHYFKDIRWEYHDCLMLGDKGYLSAEVQKDLFEVTNIRLEVPYRLNQKNYRPPAWAYKRFRKRIETIFSQLNDHLMMIRNDAKQSYGLFA